MKGFHNPPTLAQLNATVVDTLASHLGIQFVDIGNDFLSATMPVDSRTHQPMGIVHGGASVALAETLGSVGAMLCVDREKQYCVGLEINANHIKSARSGLVKGTARPLHIGSSTQVWEIHIKNERGELTCVSRITLAVLDVR